jgi:hypothetical protein
MKALAIFWIMTTYATVYSQNKPVKSSHGTINVLIANQHGLVAVTDSRLSHDLKPVDEEGKKLFILDDHTICTIAGFYFARGLEIQGKYPLQTFVPGIVDTYLIQANELKERRYPEETISGKLNRLVSLYSFALGVFANSDPLETPRDTSVITVAGYQQKELHIASATLTPRKEGGLWFYVVSEQTDETVRAQLVAKVKGVRDVGDSVLAKLQVQPHTESPILSNFASEMSKNQGQDLSLVDMQQIANLIERRTASKYPNIVGGTVQMATLIDGSVNSSTLLSVPKVDSRMMTLAEYTNITLQASGSGLPSQKDYLATVAFHDLIASTRQQLDGIAFIENEFFNCVFTYDGATMSLFDKSNKVSSSTLEIGKGVAPDNPFLLQFAKDFTDVKIIRVK